MRRLKARQKQIEAKAVMTLWGRIIKFDLFKITLVHGFCVAEIINETFLK